MLGLRRGVPVCERGLPPPGVAAARGAVRCGVAAVLLPAREPCVRGCRQLIAFGHTKQLHIISSSPATATVASNARRKSFRVSTMAGCEASAVAELVTEPRLKLVRERFAGLFV